MVKVCHTFRFGNLTEEETSSIESYDDWPTLYVIKLDDNLKVATL